MMLIRKLNSTYALTLVLLHTWLRDCWPVLIQLQHIPFIEDRLPSQVAGFGLFYMWTASRIISIGYTDYVLVSLPLADIPSM